MDCQATYGFAKDWPPLVTMSMSTASLPACGAALSLCTATHDLILHAVIILSVVDGVLLVFSMVLLFLFYSRSRHDSKESVKESTGTTESVTEKPELPAPTVTSQVARDVLPSLPEPCHPSKLELPTGLRDTVHVTRDVIPPPSESHPPSVVVLPITNPIARDVLPSPPEPSLLPVAGPPDTGHVTKDVVPSPPESHPPSAPKTPTVLPSPPIIRSPPVPNPQIDVGEKSKNRALPRVPSLTSLSASMDDRRTERSSLRSDAMSFRSTSSSSDQSLDTISINDFDQGEDGEMHPGIYRLVTEGKFSKEAVGRLAPMPPKPGTVLPDYNPRLDEARPQEINEYLNKYRIFFVIDDSRSMVRHWTETQVALAEIANYALVNYSDGVDIRFFNSRERKSGVQGAEQVVDVFKSVTRSAGTPTGRVLGEVLKEQLDRLDEAYKKGEYSSERPLDVIVLTDGVPNADSPPAPVIKEAAARLNNAKHHQNWIGIQFVQIGDNPKAEPTLLSLIDSESNNNMVDTVSYSFYKNKGGGKLTPQILERIILGGLHPNLRSFYNQYRKSVGEKTSRAIY